MSVPPELMPGPSGFEAGGEEPGDPFGGLSMDAPDLYGREQEYEVKRKVPGDLYPQNEEEYERLNRWCHDAFYAGEDHKAPLVTRWKRFYRIYRSHIEKEPGDWKSSVFVPIAFWVIETIVPRLVAQLPKFTALPMSKQWVDNAKHMETALEWAAQRSKLYVELVKAFKSALKYGTGILKTYHRTDIRKARKPQRLMASINVEQEIPVAMDLDGNPIVETRTVEVGQIPAGYASQTFQYTAYDGPAAECIDIFNFGVAPEAHDVQSARYVYHRTYKDWAEVMRRVEEGVYHLPPDMDISEILKTDDDPKYERESSIGMAGGGTDPTRKVVELIEFWTNDGRVITWANRKCVLRVQENPFDHSEKPFVRIVDHLQEHEFWGVGEIEPIEGLQDAHNALTNSRIDNLRLLINAMFFVNTHHVEDIDDFTTRPGGIIRGRGDYKPEEVFQRIDFGEPTQSAFTETQLIEQTVEKVTGVTNITMGLDQAGGTATESAILSEMGASRFGMKSKLIEIEGLTDLGRQWASLLQQFLTDEKQIRLDMVDEETGEPAFADLTPESLAGAYDIGIQSESTAQSATVRQEQKMNLLGMMAQYWPGGVQAALEEVLDAMGIKDKEKFLQQQPIDPATGQPQQPGVEPVPPELAAQMQQAQAGAGGAPSGLSPGIPGEGTQGFDQAEALVDEILAGYDQEAQA